MADDTDVVCVGTASLVVSLPFYAAFIAVIILLAMFLALFTWVPSLL